MNVDGAETAEHDSHQYSLLVHLGTHHASDQNRLSRGRDCATDLKEIGQLIQLGTTDSTRACELLFPAEFAQSHPLAQSCRIATGDQEVPAEPNPFLRKQFPHSRLGEDVSTVAVREVALRVVVGVLRVHATAEDRLELVRAVGVDVSSLQAGTELQAGADEATVYLDLVAADEQA